jgi:hypothetical protein
MTWIQEWHALLQLKAQHSLHSYPSDFRPEIYDALRFHCHEMGVIYFPTLYEEYITWDTTYGHLYRVVDGSFSPVPTNAHLKHYTTYSPIIQRQLEECDAIRKLEQFAKKEKMIFHDDSIMEKISLAAHYAGLRGGG